MEADPNDTVARRRLRGGHRGAAGGGPRPHAALRAGRVLEPRSGRRARRLRHRPERHRGQPRRAVPAWPSPCPTTSSARSSPCGEPMPRASDRSPTCAAGAWRRWGRRWRPRSSNGRAPSTASSRSSTRTTCTRTPTWRSAAWTPCCSMPCWPSAGVRRNPGLVNQPADLGVGHYVGILAPRDAALRDRVDGLLRDADARRPARGDLPRWGMWNDDQPRLYARVLAEAPGRQGSGRASRSAVTLADGVGVGGDDALSAGALARGARSRWCCRACRWLLAVASGIDHRDRARLRRRGRCAPRSPRGSSSCAARRSCCSSSSSTSASKPFVQLPAMVAAVLGLGLNYGAYESEIYRGALQAVAAGAARGGAHARLHRLAGAAPRARTAGVQARARADDQRLRRAAQGQLARVDDHRRRADQADVRSWPRTSAAGSCRAWCARRCIWPCRCRWRGWRAGSSGAGARGFTRERARGPRSAGGARRPRGRAAGVVRRRGPASCWR